MNTAKPRVPRKARNPTRAAEKPERDYRAQHNDIDVRKLPGTQKSAHRVRSRIEAMRDGKHIDDATLLAGERWRADYDRGVVGVRETAETAPGLRAANAQAHMSALQLDALTAWREARDAVGTHAYGVLHLLVLDDRAIAAIAADRGWQAQVALGVCIGCLERLAEHYVAADAVKPRKGAV